MKTIVKGTKLYPVKVAEYRPVRKAVFWILGVIFVVAAVYGAFYYGTKSGLVVTKRLSLEVTELTGELETKTARVSDLEQQLQNIALGAEVDRSASETVRKSVAQLQEELARLQEDNSFYRSLMAPNEKASGLTLGAVEVIRSSSNERTFSYHVVVKQLVTKHNILSGHLTFSIVGKLNGESQRFPIYKLSEQVDSERIKLKFKYFQTIAGELVLPENFEPDHIELTAQSAGRKPQKVEKKYGWLVEER